MTATRFEVSDGDLVAAVRRGDDSAFEELYRRYRRPIAGYVARTVRDDARVEDLTQDAFFAALRHLRSTDTEIDFKPWIYEIARNATIDHWRRASRAEEVSVDADERLRPSDRARLVGSSAPDSLLVDKERLVHLQGAFDELGDLQARALVMRELEGMSYREIAEKLDVSRSSVETTLLLARTSPRAAAAKPFGRRTYAWPKGWAARATKVALRATRAVAAPAGATPVSSASSLSPSRRACAAGWLACCHCRSSRRRPSAPRRSWRRSSSRAQGAPCSAVLI